MPTALNQFSCLTAAGNTGVPKCPVAWKNIYGFILTPAGASFDASSLVNFQSAVVLSMTAPSKSTRVFPVYNLSFIGDSSEAPVIQSFPTGQRKRVRDGYYDWMFQLLNGGAGLNKRLRQYNASPTSHDVLFVATSDGGGDFIIGTTSNTPGQIQAIPLGDGFFAANPWKASDGSKITGFELQFSFNPKWVNEFLAFVSMGSVNTQNTIQGLNDAYLSNQGLTSPSGSYAVYVLDENGTDLASLYSAVLNSTSLWSAVIPTNYSTATPGAPTLTPSATGGTVAAGTYFYKITALNANGETVGGTEASATTTGATSSVGLTWTAITGATSYRIYRGTTAGTENLYYSSATNSFTDIGGTSSAGSPPPAAGTTLTISGAPTFTAGVGGNPGYFTIAVPTTAPYSQAIIVNINLALPAALSAAGMQYYESTGPVSIAKT